MQSAAVVVTASSADASATLNTVEPTVLGEPEVDIAGDLLATADIDWTENLTGDDEVLLEDDRSGHSETINSSTRSTTTRSSPAQPPTAACTT